MTDPSKAKPRFKRLSREVRMADIEAAARSAFAAHGFAAASVAEIAERAGVVEGTIYKYYASKRTLLLTVITRWYEGMIKDYLEELRGVVGTRARMATIVRQHLLSIKANPDLCLLFYNEVRGADDYYHSELAKLNRVYTRVLVDVVQQGVTNGELRPDTPVDLIRDIIFGAVEHHVSAFLAERGDFDVFKVTDALVGLVLNGCMAVKTPTGNFDDAITRLEAVVDRIDREKGSSC